MKTLSEKIAVMQAAGFMAATAIAVSPAFAGQTYDNMRVERVLRVHDGDTLYVDIANCTQHILCENIGIRIRGIDTPELWTKNACEKALAIKATTLMHGLIDNAKKIELRNPSRGKYFRIVADVYADGKSVAQAEIDAGLAHRYDGGTKSAWCADLTEVK